MKFNVPAVRKCLKSFDFDTLFREHLGWDKHQTRLDVPVNGATVRLSAVAQKRGFIAYLCDSIPDRPTRLKIDHRVTKTSREHFVIYADQASGQQVWQWVRRERGKPIASRDHRFDTGTSGDALIQRLDQIAVDLAEEEQLALTDVTRKAKAAFDVDKVTKKFYDRFKDEHAAFLKFIKAIKAQGDLEWYTSLMLNRLMFVYFIQKKGFLAGDTNYLRNRLQKVREARGKGKFQSFYRFFLLRLFHDGLGKHEKERSLETTFRKLLGKVPFLNGGFFEVHQLEEQYPDIDIPDEAFDKLFDFFDQYSWHLDDRPLRAGNEINPDVVGYIFEKYVNRKEMGAYYTKEDITEYISKNTIIPFLFDAAQKKCPIAFRPESFLWRLLRDDPDRYIYSAVRHGVINDHGDVIPLPAEIEAGVTDVTMREGWNRHASDPFGLPTETWREHVARRQRCLELRETLVRGDVHEINDLVTLNLDIWQFARDAIANSEGPDLVRAFWQSIVGRLPEAPTDKFEPGITVLDPTCGSGAFLFAALRILETLYSDCLSAMQTLVAEADLTRDLTPETEARALISRGETKQVEFKARAFKHPKASQPNSSLIGDIAAAVASFLNAEGGNILVGVSNDGTVCGVMDDMDAVNPQRQDEDSYLLWLQQKLEAHLGADIVACVGLSMVKVEGLPVVHIRISPSAKPVFVTLNGKKAFYVRAEKGRLDMDVEATIEYVRQHFSSERLTAPKPKRVAGLPQTKPKFADLRAVLDAVQSHASERYFILKSIIVNNLFGVDIMEEAVEICKLRLFLKLVAQVDSVDQIEPLPDIDFNIRAGNTLVGYVSLEEIRTSQKGKFGFGVDVVRRIEDDARAVDKAFQEFRAQQVTCGDTAVLTGKQELLGRLAKLDGELDRYLASEYGIDPDNAEAFDQWKTSHQPFHWLVEFYSLMEIGGFDVVIGNPPYLERNKLNRRYSTIRLITNSCRDIYAWCVERAIRIHAPNGRFGLIVPVSIASSENFAPVRRLVSEGRTSLWLSHFANRPGQLFAGAQSRLTIVLRATTETPSTFSTRYHRWDARNGERGALMATMRYVRLPKSICGFHGLLPKVGQPEAVDVLQKVLCRPTVSDWLVNKSLFPIYWVRVPGYFCQFFLEPPMAKPEAGGPSRVRGEVNTVFCPDEHAQRALHSILNSSVYYQFFCAFTDGRHLNPSDIRCFPCDPGRFRNTESARLLERLSQALEGSMREHTKYWRKSGLLIESVDSAEVKPILDEIDSVLADEYVTVHGPD